eukprot:14163472-Ditylum_brightwellii.AAC.1
MFWNREFSDYKTLNQISNKDAGFGANATVQESEAAYCNLEEAVDNLAYAATTSNNVVEKLAVQEENNRLLKIIELSITTRHGTAAIPPPSGKNRRNKQKINYEATDVLMEPE